jgi:hypothetical protein
MLSQPKAVGETAHCCWIGLAADPSFQIGNATLAESSLLGKLLLRQTRGEAVMP